MKRQCLDFDGKVTTWKEVSQTKGYSLGYVKKRFRGHYMPMATLRGQGKPNALVSVGLWLKLVPSIIAIVSNRSNVRFNIRNVGVFGVYVNPESGVTYIKLIVLEFGGKKLQCDEEFFPLDIFLVSD